MTIANNPVLITKEEARQTLVCDVCGLNAPKYPWPEGWHGCGRSRWRVYRDARDPTVGAHWCPLHSAEISTTPNPAVSQLRRLRDGLLAAEKGEQV